MASAPSEDELVKISSEAALEFVKEYYTALTDSRPTIENYYCKPEAIKEAKDGSTSTPVIEWNGNAYATAAAFKTMYTESMPKYVNFDVHAVDAQVLNPQFALEAGPKVKPAKNVSIIVPGQTSHLNIKSKVPRSRPSLPPNPQHLQSLGIFSHINSTLRSDIPPPSIYFEMKCVDNTGDRKADAVVRADDQLCDEYGTHLASDGAICSWIAVNNGQKIVVETGFVGMTKEIQFDLVIDGVLRNSEKTNRRAEKKDRKSERFDHGFYAQSKSVINQAELEVKALDVSAYPSVQVEAKDSVGAIELRISVLRDEHEERHKLDDVKSFETIMDWREAYRTPSYTKIRPVQQVDFIPIDQQPTKVQITKLKQRATTRRPGAKPWVVFRFYYRTQDAINNEALTKTANKNATKFDALPIVKTDVEAPSPSTASLLSGTTSATTAKEPSSKVGTTATTAEASSPKAATVAEAISTAADFAITTAEASDRKKNATNDTAPKLPAENSKDAVTQPIVSSTDLGSEQSDLVLEAISTTSPANNFKSSTNKTTEKQPLPASINQLPTMDTSETQPIAATIQPTIVNDIQETPEVIMADVAAQILADEHQQAPVANMAASIVRADSPRPIHLTPIAKMLPDVDTTVENPTPPSTPKFAVTQPALSKISAIAASLLDTTPSTESTTVMQAEEAPQTEIAKALTNEVPESIIEPIELKVEPVPPITSKSIEKVKVEHSRSYNGLKRALSATPTPDPATKRMKLENGELEKRLAEKKKALAEKRANRIKAQDKASEAQQKAASAEARRKEALEKMLADMEDEIAEEERLAQEAEEQLEASETIVEDCAQEVFDDADL
ncbi:gb [Venturia nashicola]|uniref:Gb n=1 Tax=Venturia nashicola TaxID=86259 RepID=A0A4Z1PHC8_9PEZI|nr:gb [Venturia nashicola]